MSQFKSIVLLSRQRLCIVLLSLVMIGTGVTAQPTATAGGPRFWARYAEIAGMFDKFNGIPAGDRSLLDLKLALRTTGSAVPGQRLQFTLVPTSSSSPFGIGADGYMAFPQSGALRRVNPSIFVNLPAQNRVIIFIVSRYAGDTSRPIGAGTLLKFVDQARRAVASQGGMFSFFMPKPEGIRFRVGAVPGRVTVRYRNGRSVTSELSSTGESVVISAGDLGTAVSDVSVDRSVNIEAYSKKPLSVTVDSESK